MYWNSEARFVFYAKNYFGNVSKLSNSFHGSQFADLCYWCFISY